LLWILATVPGYKPPTLALTLVPLQVTVVTPVTMVTVTVVPTDAAGEPLSVAVILNAQLVALAGAVKLTLQFAGRPVPLTVIVKPHDVPLFEQVKL